MSLHLISHTLEDGAFEQQILTIPDDYLRSFGSVNFHISEVGTQRPTTTVVPSLFAGTSLLTW